LPGLPKFQELPKFNFKELGVANHFAGSHGDCGNSGSLGNVGNVGNV
jgi:hypothetical protein